MSGAGTYGYEGARDSYASDQGSIAGSMTNVSEWAEIEGTGLKSACVGRGATFDISAKGLRPEDIDAKVLGK